jgi:anti-sigma regulatory factor (Ser/Thr protein kinase)
VTAKRASLSLKNDVTELERVAAGLEEFGNEAGLSDEVVGELNLCLEEILTNIMFYGLEEGRDPDSLAIELGLEVSDRALTVRVQDNGKPFNPLDAGDPDTELPVEERAIGGLGIHLVRELMDELLYAREGDRNVLTMKKGV